MRITQGTMVNSQLSRLQNRLERFERAQSQLGTGKAILKPSDDPAAANRGLLLRASQRARVQEARNGADASSWLALADSKLEGATTRLHRARDLTVSGASNQDPGSQRAMATEIEAIRDELIGIANSQHAGRPLFTGFAEGKAVVPDGGVWRYGGDDGVINRRVSEHDVVKVNVTAADAFGPFAVAPDDPTDVFSLLDTIAAALRNGDQATLTGKLAELDVAMERIGDQQSILGAATNRVEAAMARNADEQLSIRSELAVTEDVDIAGAVMELQTQEVAYQATLAALSRVLQPSLVDFLR
ncbi:MAG: flagellin [Nitriliruptor sp.]|uniref:flagellin N-terminal helical domain-containing protein n=1 Tax=Nitriliruptor sp. TaxID=2448056 RepID=UPI0034A03CEC